MRVIITEKRQDKTRQERGEEEEREEKRERERDIFKYTYTCVSLRRRLVTHVSVHTLTFHGTHYPLSPLPETIEQFNT